MARRRTAAVGLILLTAGCAAIGTAIGKRNLEVQTLASSTIFLDPVTADRQTLFVQIRNTSDKPDFDIAAGVRDAIRARGYRVVDDPDDAQYLLQANVLQVGVTSPTATEQNLGGGFGSAVVGGAVGAGVGRAISTETSTIIAGALIGAAAEGLAGAWFEDVTYSITTDVQISERAGKGVLVTETTDQKLIQGSAGVRIIAASETSDWKRYQTRVVSTANQVNLDFEDAAPELVAGLTRSIAGIF